MRAHDPDSSCAGRPIQYDFGAAAKPIVDWREWPVNYTRSRAQPRSHNGRGESVHSVDYWSMAFVFVLATFVGLQVIQGVSRLLHTPLMSLTNAISAIAVVGSIIIAGEQKSTISTVLGVVAVAASVTNIVSGFLITDRMLKMFRERTPRGENR